MRRVLAVRKFRELSAAAQLQRDEERRIQEMLEAEKQRMEAERKSREEREMQEAEEAQKKAMELEIREQLRKEMERQEAEIKLKKEQKKKAKEELKMREKEDKKRKKEEKKKKKEEEEKKTEEDKAKAQLDEVWEKVLKESKQKIEVSKSSSNLDQPSVPPPPPPQEDEEPEESPPPAEPTETLPPRSKVEAQSLAEELAEDATHSIPDFNLRPSLDLFQLKQTVITSCEDVDGDQLLEYESQSNTPPTQSFLFKLQRSKDSHGASDALDLDVKMRVQQVYRELQVDPRNRKSTEISGIGTRRSTDHPTEGGRPT